MDPDRPLVQGSGDGNHTDHRRDPRRPGSVGGGGWGGVGGGGEVRHKASVSGCLPLAVAIGLSLLLILTLCGPKRVLVVSTEPLDDLSCLTTPESAVLETGCCPCR